jgi:hypothetical protein
VDRFVWWLRSRRGASSIFLSLALVTVGVKAGSIPAVEAPFAALVGVVPAAMVVWLLAALWEDKTFPQTPRYARPQEAVGSRQFRDDANAKIASDRLGFLFAKRYFFVGTGCPPVRLTARDVEEWGLRSGSVPVLVASTKARRYWLYRGAFVWENQGLAPKDVMALIHDRDRKRVRALDRAHVLLDVEQGRSAEMPRRRQPIPREVRQEVFARDGGRCVECQSDFDLQYDHVIPWSHGGADTTQNLQLLCAPCNTQKGASF